MATDSPLSIGVVSRMTGVPADTLRMWERRYGFPKPRRTPGGTRQYAAEDLDKLRIAVELLGHGYRPGSILSRPASDLTQLLRTVGARKRTEPDAALATPAQLLEKLSALDTSGIQRDLRRAGEALGPRRFVRELANPLMNQIGAAWQDGRLGVRHEHLMTELLTTELRHLYASLPEPSGPRVLLATLPNELHRLALDLFALDIGSLGVDVTILGADTPASEIAKVAVALEVDAVGLFAAAPPDMDKSRHALEALILALPRRVRVWLGGPAASEIEIPDLQHFASYRELDREIGKLRSGHRTPASRDAAHKAAREARLGTQPSRARADR